MFMSNMYLSRSFLRPTVSAQVRLWNSTRYYSMQIPAHKPTPLHRIQISDEVRTAIAHQEPVVALETTIYTHGFPYPENVALARSLEDIVRQNGAVPATIGIIDGFAKVGLSSNDLLCITEAAGKPETMKVSRKDLPYILGLGLAGRGITGGTTVSATMMLARTAGIRVFGTGGIGGVHRCGENTMDVSADLTELGRTSVAVISSGCKSFLDIPRTLEYLETQGVGVYTFARGRAGRIDFPAFYTSESGVESHMVIQNAQEAASIIAASGNMDLHLQSGMLFANPIPEEFSIPKEDIDNAINQAVQEAADQGIHGHANTPFILARIKELTQGNSIHANRALIKSNVAMAAQVAVELAKLMQTVKGWKKSMPGKSIDPPKKDVAKGSGNKTGVPKKEIDRAPEKVSKSAAKPEKKSEEHRPVQSTIPSQIIPTKPVEPDFSVLVFGSVAVDLSCDHSPSEQGAASPLLHTSNIASITSSIGGVGHNVALAAHLVKGTATAKLCSIVADDFAGNTILSALQSEGLSSSGILKLPLYARDKQGRILTTAQYVAVNDSKKDLVVAMADMNLIASNGPDFRNHIFNIPTPEGLKWIVVDANLNPALGHNIMAHYAKSNINVAFEPVSVAKSQLIFSPEANDPLSPRPLLEPYPNNLIELSTPNQHELAAMYEAAKRYGHLESKEWWNIIDAFGIPSSGARDRFKALTNETMTDAGIPLLSVQLLPFFPNILTKLGPEGVLLTALLTPDDTRLKAPEHAPYILSRSTIEGSGVGGVYMRLFPPEQIVPDDEIVSVNGVGDTFLGVLVSGLARGSKLNQRLISVAQKGAVMTLKSNQAVSPKLFMLRAALNY